ncbi:DUF488 family protein [Catenulispora subtropica]|uniref:DUF488 domain-containing protein n=1 Tax=Catenulispora subtropica TaxID=450798 RepID=A0ABN2QS73_9ACTN
MPNPDTSQEQLHGPCLFTFGHGLADRTQIAGLLHGSHIRAVVDVRTAPGSRRNPDASRQALTHWLPEHDISYRWEPRLGGFRKTAPDSPDTFWENESFRGYAGYTRQPQFLQAMNELLDQAATTPTAVMCAETLWWRCHRRIIADYAVLIQHTRVQHLGHDGHLTEHQPTAGARVRADGLLIYDR